MSRDISLAFLITILFVSLSPLSAMAEKVIDSRYITSDTVWEGEITVTGIVKVAKAATLTIRPGTIVSFTRRDLDGEGLGSNALFLQGRLLAQGTKENPILFTSAQANKKRGDWDGINLIASDRTQNILKFCRIKYAVRGVHSHFANLVISDCDFSDNFRGIYCQEMKVKIERSRFVKNLSGMRIRDSELILEDNVFSDNYWGTDVFHSRILISRNLFVDNLLYGLRVRRGRGEVVENIFQRNQLGLRFQDSVVLMKKNRIINNYETGVSFLSSEITAQENTISRNPSEGVLARESVLSFTANTLRNNGVGISIKTSPRADIAYNLITLQTGNGISAKNSNLLLRENRISKNEEGVRIKDSQSCHLIGNRIYSNRKNGLSAEASNIISHGDFLAGNENGLKAKESRFVFRQTTFENNRIAGLDIEENSSASIYGSVIRRNKEMGITSANKALEIIDSQVIENGCGIDIKNSDSITILRSTISNNRKYGARIEGTKGTIAKNIFEGNITGIQYSFSDLAITGNRIRKNRRVGLSASDSISVLSGNRIEENQTGIIFIRSESAVADGNLIGKNTEEGLFIQNASDSSITGNDFTENGIGIRTDNSYIKLSGNRFWKNQEKALILLGSTDVFAENNWWGTTDETEIGKMIHDINDGVDAGEVFFAPYSHKSPFDLRDTEKNSNQGSVRE